jgi:hypothetical protein
MAPRYVNGIWVDDEEQQPGEEFAGVIDSETGEYTPVIPSATTSDLTEEGVETSDPPVAPDNSAVDAIALDPEKAATAADAKNIASVLTHNFLEKNPYAGERLLPSEQKYADQLWAQEQAAKTQFKNLSLAGGKDDSDVDKYVAQAILAFAPIIGGYMLGGNELAAYGSKLGVKASEDYRKEVKTKDKNEKTLTRAQQLEIVKDSETRQKELKTLALAAARRNNAGAQAVSVADQMMAAGHGPKQANVNVSLNTAELPNLSTDKEAAEAARLATEAVRVKQLAAQILAPEDLVGFIDPKTREVDYAKLAEAGLDTLGGKVLGSGNSRIQEWQSSVLNLKDILLRIRTGAAANVSEAEAMDRIIDGGGILASDIPTALRMIDRFIDNQRNNYRYRSQYIRENAVVGGDPGESFDRIIGLGQPLGNEGVMRPTTVDNRPYNPRRAKLEAYDAANAARGGR